MGRWLERNQTAVNLNESTVKNRRLGFGQFWRCAEQRPEEAQ
jgi:hypothetical protein